MIKIDLWCYFDDMLLAGKIICKSLTMIICAGCAVCIIVDGVWTGHEGDLLGIGGYGGSRGSIHQIDVLDAHSGVLSSFLLYCPSVELDSTIIISDSIDDTSCTCHCNVNIIISITCTKLTAPLKDSLCDGGRGGSDERERSGEGGLGEVEGMRMRGSKRGGDGGGQEGEDEEEDDTHDDRHDDETRKEKTDIECSMTQFTEDEE